MIALQSHIDSIAIISAGASHGQPDHPKTRRSRQSLSAAAFGAKWPLGGRGGPGDPGRASSGPPLFRMASSQTVAPLAARARPPKARQRDRPAPHHPDHRRRHRRLQGAGFDPAAQGTTYRRPLRADQGRAAIRHPACRQRAVAWARLHRPVRSRQRIRCRSYSSGTRKRPDRGGARDRRPDGEDGAGPCRRSRQRDPARGQPADPAGAGDEPPDVEQCRDPPQRRTARPRRHRHDRTQCRRNG